MKKILFILPAIFLSGCFTSTQEKAVKFVSCVSEKSNNVSLSQKKLIRAIAECEIATDYNFVEGTNCKGDVSILFNQLDKDLKSKPIDYLAIEALDHAEQFQYEYANKLSNALR